jgi:hypothetical protein
MVAYQHAHVSHFTRPRSLSRRLIATRPGSAPSGSSPERGGDAAVATIAAKVLAVQGLVLAALWLFSRHFR